MSEISNIISRISEILLVWEIYHVLSGLPPCRDKSLVIHTSHRAVNLTNYYWAQFTTVDKPNRSLVTFELIFQGFWIMAIISPESLSSQEYLHCHALLLHPESSSLPCSITSIDQLLKDCKPRFTAETSTTVNLKVSLLCNISSLTTWCYLVFHRNLDTL